MRARGVLVPLVAAVAILLVVGRAVSTTVVSHAWFGSMGATRLFWEVVVDGLLLQGGAWMVGTVFAFLNFHAVRRTILAVAMPVRVGNLELTAMIPGRRLTVVTVLLAMIVAALLAAPLTNWSDLALVRHGVPFGEIEGITGRDLGFFVYWLPLEETLYLWALVSVVTVTALVLVLYALTRSLRLQGRRVAVSTHVRRHLSVLGALVLGLLAWSYRLDAFDLLVQGSGPDGLFLRVDHLITLRVDLLLAVLCALAAPTVLRTGWTGQLRAAVLTVSVVLGAAVILRHVLPAVVARSDWLGRAPERDRDYLATRVAFSRRAFDVDAMRVDSTRLLGNVDSTASWESVWRASVRTRDDLVGTVIGATDASHDPVGPSAQRPEVLAGREAAAGGEPLLSGWWSHQGVLDALVIRPAVDRNQDWSVAVAPLTDFSGRDRPMTAVLPEVAGGDRRWAWPLVGPGQEGAVLVPAALAADVVTVPLESSVARLAHAWALRDPSLLRVHSRVADPGIVTVRDVRERLRRLVPVLVQGREMSPLLDGRRVVWSVPLYAASHRYPLSQRWAVAGGTYGYFRFAGTAFVEANSGRVRILPTTTPDPLLRSWIRRFPELFTTAEALGPMLLSQIPPSFERTQVQLHTFARYGSRSGDPVGRRLPDGVLTGGRTPPPYLGAADSVVAQPTIRWTVPLVNGAEQVDGLITAIGGRDPGTTWLPLPEPHARWSAVRPDSVVIRRDSSRVRPASGKPFGVPHVLPAPRGFVVWQRQPTDTGAGHVVHAVYVRDGEVATRRATSLQAVVTALGGGTWDQSDGRSAAPLGSASALVWYERMQAALQRGDWGSFGVALDSLGGVLRRDGGGRAPP